MKESQKTELSAVNTSYQTEEKHELEKKYLNTEVFEYFEEEQGEYYNLKENRESILTFEEFKKRGFLSGESWDRILNVPAKILDISKEFVFCECVLDREKLIFETRSFSRDLFSHILGLSVNNLVLIKMKTKPGAFRIDVYNGAGIVDSSIFDIQEDLEELKSAGFGKPFKYD